MKSKITAFFALICLLGVGFVPQLAFADQPHGEAPAAHEEVHATGQHGEEAHDAGHDGEFNAGEMIMHHIADAHQVHFMSWGDFHIEMPLPIILYTDNGLEVFSSSHFYHQPAHYEGVAAHAFEHDNFVMVDEVIYYKNSEGGVSVNETGKITNEAPFDLSITKTVFGLLISSTLVILIFLAVARAYKRKGSKAAPSGILSLFEPLILFVKDEVIVPSVGSAEKARKFTPFLLSVFFLIWIANLLGLMSFLGGYNVMGSMAVTVVLAFFVMIITNINGNGHYWKHIFCPDGVPLPIKFILVPIEMVQIVMKPLVLMIRLTANITAGHIIILAFTALIFIFGQSSAVAGYSVGAGSLLFMVFMFCIELLVAFLQAYVFTLLSALYFGSAVEEHHHHEEAH